MKINYYKTAQTLILIGISLFIINAADVYLGYYLTHGKGFQIIGIILMVVGIFILIKSR
jgi:hypothetical protein